MRFREDYHQLTLGLHQDTLRQLAALGDTLGVGRTEAVRRAIQEAVRRHLGTDAPPDAPPPGRAGWPKGRGRKGVDVN